MVREVVALAEGSPLLAHIKGYCEYPESIPPSEVCLLAADINFGGIKDIIENAPVQGSISWHETGEKGAGHHGCGMRARLDGRGEEFLGRTCIRRMGIP